MALQFDIEPVAEQALQSFKPRRGEMALPGRDGAVERSAGPASERDDAVGLALEPFELEARRLVSGVSRKAREDSRIRLR